MLVVGRSNHGHGSPATESSTKIMIAVGLLLYARGVVVFDDEPMAVYGTLYSDADIHF